MQYFVRVRTKRVRPLVKYSYANKEDLLMVTELKEGNQYLQWLSVLKDIKIIANSLSSQGVYTYFVTINSS